MKKIIISLLLFTICITAFAQQSYFVSANGNDSNNGLTENNAFATLSRAIQAASTESIKQITVVGTLQGFTMIRDTGSSEILITGKPDASEYEKAVLIPTEPLLFNIQGNSNIRLENIILQGTLGISNANSQGIGIDGAVVTLGRNLLITKFSANAGAGVNIRSGTLRMTGNATIAGNRSQQGGGIYVNRGTLVMEENAIIRDNEARNGAGIYNWAGLVQLRGNSLVTANKAESSGGGVYNASRLEFSGGRITGRSFTSHTFRRGNIRGNTAASANDGPDVFEDYT